jgi:hypothetical protein
MRIKYDGYKVAALAAAALAVVLLALPAYGADVCPEDGKVESVVDGDLDGIVLEAGTVVCIKGGQALVTRIADGIDTLFLLLGTGQNVSHYTILEEPSATTTTSTTSSTTSTTTAETTTTTSEGSTTSAPTTTVPSTSTTLPSTTTSESTTSSVPAGSDSTVTSMASSTTPEPPKLGSNDPGAPVLPFTGFDITWAVLIGAVLLGGGVSVVRWARA